MCIFIIKVGSLVESRTPSYFTLKSSRSQACWCSPSSQHWGGRDRNDLCARGQLFRSAREQRDPVSEQQTTTTMMISKIQPDNICHFFLICMLCMVCVCGVCDMCVMCVCSVCLCDVCIWGVCGCVNTLMVSQRPEKRASGVLLCHFLPYSLETRSVTELGWQSVSKSDNFSVSTTHTCGACPAFYVGSGI